MSKDFVLSQMVNEPTRKGNLLDVVLTDLVDETETKVLPSITDQSCARSSCIVIAENGVAVLKATAIAADPKF